MIRVNTREEFLSAIWQHDLIEVDSMCAEIGVYRGDFSQMIYNKFTPLELVLIDPFDIGGGNYNEMKFPTSYSTTDDYISVVNRFKNLHTIWVYRHWSYDAVYHFTDNYFDFIYHDASHLKDHLKKDLIDWLPKLKPSGLMCGHDYIQHPDFGVIQAVDEFCKEYNFEMIIFNENGGDYALKRK